MRMKQRDVQVSEIMLKTANHALQGSTAKWHISQWTMAKSQKSIQIMLQQKQKLEKIVNGKKSLITISKVEFNVTSYQPSVKLIPLRVHMQDKKMAKSTLDVIANFDKESASFLNIAQLVVSSYTDYIPMYRFRQNVNTKHISEERSALHWSLICINYNEKYGTLKNIISILNDGIMKSSDNGDIDHPVSKHPLSSTSESDGVKKLIDAMGKMTISTTENVNNVITRWKRTSQRIWSEDVGLACIGFIDCFNAQMRNLSLLFEPEMKGYNIALDSIAQLKGNIRILTTQHGMKKNSAMQLMKHVVASLTNIDNNAHFCEESPKLTKQMPISVLAYTGGDFELACTIAGPASMEFRWWKNNQTIPNQKSWKLEIDEVTMDDGGSYQCEGKTLTTSVKSNQVLVRIYQAMNITTQPIDHVLDYPGGKDVMFNCNGTAEPEAVYKWWFKRYDYGNPKATMKPVVMTHSSILTIKRATVKHTGQYWCELSNGYSSIYSRKAKLDVVRVLQMKQSALLHLALSINKHNVSCTLPKTKDATGVIATLQTMLQSTIGLPEKDDIKLKYKLNFADDSKADLAVAIGLKHQVKSAKDSVSHAFHVSQQRNKLHSLLTLFVGKLKKTSEGLPVPWKMCNISMRSTVFSIDWRAEELVCPAGMGPSAGLVKCGMYFYNFEILYIYVYK